MKTKNSKEGGKKETWMCGCGDIHDMAVEYCLGCDDKRPTRKEGWEKRLYTMMSNLVVLNGWAFVEWKDKKNYRENWKQFVVFRDFISSLLLQQKRELIGEIEGWIKKQWPDDYVDIIGDLSTYLSLLKK